MTWFFQKYQKENRLSMTRNEDARRGKNGEQTLQPTPPKAGFLNHAI